MVATHFDRTIVTPTNRGRGPAPSRSRGWRARWAAIGAAIAVVAGTGGVAFSGATNAQITPSQTLITPCRIMDTRSGPNNVGPRSTPLNGGETYRIQVSGANSICNIPAGTSGVVMNVTIVGPGSNGFITVFPGPDRPTASNLNYTAGQSPTPNQVTVALSATGGVSFYASGGPVNLIADIAGYTTAARLTNTQLAQNRWDQDLAKPATIDVGIQPVGVAFDGTRIWVTDYFDGTATRINPATGTVIGSPIAVGSFPSSIEFDGTNMWVTNVNSNYVTRIDAATGTVIGSPITVGSLPSGIAFDGTNMWVTNASSNNVTRINATTGTVIGSPIAVGTKPIGIAFDGTDMWVTNSDSNDLTRIRAATGNVVGSPIAVGTDPIGIAFDGTTMWVANQGSDSVTRIDAATRTVVGSPIAVGTGPTGIAFDGTNIWVTNEGSDSVTRIDAATGTVIGAPVTVGDRPLGISFDGTNMWVANSFSSTVTKLRAS